MGLAKRRRTLGYSQERLAELIGVDRTTVGRWETGRAVPQPYQRSALASALCIGLRDLDVIFHSPSDAAPQEDRLRSGGGLARVGDPDDMIRRSFIRLLAVTGAIAAVPVEEAEASAHAASTDAARTNIHLWHAYRLARSKTSVRPLVRDRLTTLNEALAETCGGSRPLLVAAAELFQLAGEVDFDADLNRDASNCYLLAAAAGQEARAFDLWACAMVRLAHVDLAEHRYRQADHVLGVAERLARRGDSTMSTRHWVASVQAQAYAGLGDLHACERALDRAEGVAEPASGSAPGGWLRFDGSRLSEERGARYVQLGQLDLAEHALLDALARCTPVSGGSLRRRGSVLADLASIGARRRDPDQVLLYGGEAVALARGSSSAYAIRRLRGLGAELGALAGDRRVAELGAEIGSLSRP
jgi:transcriptional regulator with XRE-family HTH domain